MISVLGIGESGLVTQSQWMAALASNIANQSTPGYGSRQVEFASLPERSTRPPQLALGGNVLSPGLAYNQGAMLVMDAPQFGQSIVPAPLPGDLAINGKGFFVVQKPGGGLAYTRAGTFAPDASGTLVTPSGARLYPPVVIPPGDSFSVAADGTVTAQGPGGAIVAGRIQIALIPNPAGLTAIGQNLYQTSAASGTPVVVVPGSQGAGTLVSGALNGSGVSLAQSLVSLIQAQTVYGLNAKVVSVGEAITRTTTNLQV